MGTEGQDPSSTIKYNLAVPSEEIAKRNVAPVIPGNVPLPRNDPYQRPSNNVMGHMGFYCTDTCTPIFDELLSELIWDGETIQSAVELATQLTMKDGQPDDSSSTNVVYALCTHPGHHSSKDAFGGYCYVNHSALAARLLQEKLSLPQQLSSSTSSEGPPKVAILDIDYHCGNGTASIFCDDPSVLMISIHCHPDWEYPFHSGFDDERGVDEGVGTTIHLPLMPQTTWSETYRVTLQRAMNEIQSFDALVLVVSLGLDTHAGDPCAVRRAGFLLQGDDYKEMGTKTNKRATTNMTTNHNATTKKNTAITIRSCRETIS